MTPRPDFTSPEPRTRVAQDTRGAILLLGIALGLVIATALWALVGTSDVIALQEAAQNGADAGALANAIWHARGMNMVAAINIVMALAVGALVLWRFALAVSSVVVLEALIASLVDPGAAIDRRSDALASLSRLSRADEAVAGSVASIISGLDAAQEAVAAYTPVLAARERALQAGAAPELAMDTFSASLSRTPHLPVERARYSLLCERTGAEQRTDEAVRELARLTHSSRLGSARLTSSGSGAPAQEPALRALSQLNDPDGTALVARLSGLASGVAPAVFCAPSGAPRDELAGVARRLSRANGAPTIDTLPEALDAWQHLRHAWSATDVEAPPGQPAQVLAAARNGSVHMRSAALVAETGVVAHAEMYFDCSERWERCAPDALWQLRWTARLRRVQPLPVLLGSLEPSDRHSSRTAAERALGIVGRSPGIGALPPVEYRPIGLTPVFEALIDRAAPRSGDMPGVPLSTFLREGSAAHGLIH